jgi:hypothetical protein
MTKIDNKKDEGLPTGIERRRARRRPILATFSMYLVIPKKGLYKLTVHDISELGIGFDLDVEGESSSDFPVQIGDKLDSRLYLNQSLYIPLSLQIARVEDKPIVRRVGAEFQEHESINYKAFLSLLGFLDKMADALQVDTEGQSEIT